MIFRRRTPPSPVLTNEAHARWLRAGRPPYVMFLGLTELEQEALAAIGDDHQQELVETFALALANPYALAAGVDARDAAAGDLAAEETLARRVAGDLVSKILAQRAPPAAPAPKTMPRESLAGFGERRTESHTNGRRAPTLFGRAPDEAAP